MFLNPVYRCSTLPHKVLLCFILPYKVLLQRHCMNIKLRKKEGRVKNRHNRKSIHRRYIEEREETEH